MRPEFYYLVYFSWILWPLQCFATPPNDGLQSWSDSLDLNNISALQSAVDAFRDKYFVPVATSPLQKPFVPPQGRSDLSLASRQHLQGRQTCTGGADNYCFANSNSYCANCGLCCTQAAGGWCCDASASCCPPDTSIAGHQGCCVSGQLCDSTLGCIWPTVTITTTSTALSTVFVYYTSTDAQPSTTTVISTLFSTETTTISNAKTATIVDTTVTKVIKRAEPTWTTRPSGVAESGERIDHLPEVVLATSPNLDRLEQKLHEIGLLVKRDNAVTSTVTLYTTATTTIATTVISNVATVFTTTSMVSITTTQTVYQNADNTVHITSTLSTSPGATISSGTAAAASTSNVSPNTAPTSKGLSTGAQAGIGVGSAGGSLIICLILFFFWRRRPSKSSSNSAHETAPPKNTDTPVITSSISNVSPSVPELYHDNVQHYGHNVSPVPELYGIGQQRPPLGNQYGRPLSQEELQSGYTMRPLTPGELQGGYTARHEMPNTGYQAGNLNQQRRYEMDETNYR